jgi:hypothetical protein
LSFRHQPASVSTVGLARTLGRMKYALSLLVALLVLGPSSGAEPLTHCRKPEKTFFTCTAVNGKVISVCADWTDESKPPSFVQYRYGRLGASELTFPSWPEAPSGRFRFSSESSAKWRTTYLQFADQGFVYTLYAYDYNAMHEASVTVVSPTGARTVLACSAVGPYSISPLWPMELLRLEPIDQAFR